MKVLVIGATGQVGSCVAREARQRGDTVITAQRSPGGDILVDLAQPQTLTSLETVVVDIVVVAAGYAHVDGAEDEPAGARAVNRDAVDWLARWAAQRGTRLVYYSTDYVFDGARGNYVETDPSSPLSEYGRSKLEGEQCVLGASASHLVLRTSVVYGPDPQGKNFVYQMRRAHALGKRLRVPTDQISNPTFAPDLAWATLELCARGASGLFHATGPLPLSRVAFAETICDVFEISKGVIDPQPTSLLGQRARRPLRAELNDGKLRATLGRPLCAPREGLERLRKHLQGTT